MEYRPLGETGLNVGVIGLGVEHLKKKPVGDVARVIREAVGGGVNYIDLVWSFSDVIRGVAEGVGGSRDDVHLAVHLGSCYKNGKYQKSRTPRRCEEFFRDTLRLLDRDSADVINVTYVKDLKDWDVVTKPRGVLDLAVRLRDDGLGRVVAVSTHDHRVVELAARNPEVGSVMFQVNMANHALEGRDDALRLCAENGKGVVAMKPYARGNLLKTGKKVKFATYHAGGLRFEARIPEGMTPTKCLGYALSQPGVCCAVPGVKNVQELHGGLEYLNASEAERDYRGMLNVLC